MPATDRPNSSFKTDMEFAASISGVLTFGNINWLSKKNIDSSLYNLQEAALHHYKPVFCKNRHYHSKFHLIMVIRVKEFLCSRGARP